MRIGRRETLEGQGPYKDILFVTSSSRVSDQTGATAFEQASVTVPSTWSQVATDVLATKYFRKAGVASRLRRVEEHDVPCWLWPSVPDIEALLSLPEAEQFGGESDARQVFDRIAGAITYWGWKCGYFKSEADAHAFHDEIRYALATQSAAPNSPQWFNTGLHWAYGIEGQAQGHFFVDPLTDAIRATRNAFERPQTHSCFIQSVEDDLVSDGGILPLFVDEARIAKYGSGTGANFSNIRGASEGLTGGGRACGLIAVLRASDRSASLVTANGSTRRSSKMVVVDIDHPDIEAFIRWKADEERKVASLITGSKTCQQHLNKLMQAAAKEGHVICDPGQNPALRRAIGAARKAHVPENYIRRAVQFAEQGFESIEFPVFNGDWDQEAYATVAGQNANNTVRVTDEFLRVVEKRGTWDLIARRGRRPVKSVQAADLWDDIGHAAWASADPGIHFATTINDSHTCPVTDEIRASNSCSEYLFLNDTGATLASLNLLRFKTQDEEIDLDKLEHACRLWTVALDISVSMAQFPSAAIARRTYDYRPLGLGFANLGGLLMRMGIPYDSDEGRSLCAGLTAVLSGASYAASAEMARDLGAFNGYASNRDPMLRVIRNHRNAALGLAADYEGVSVPPVPLDAATLIAIPELNGAAIAARARDVWTRALDLGGAFGFRNAQVSCIAPTGTIGLVLDCDTTGIEPDFALVKFKKLAGGGYFKIINRAVLVALEKLGYSQAAISAVQNYAIGHGSLETAPFINRQSLAERGFTPDKIEAIERALPAAFDIQFVFNKWTLGEDFLTEALKVAPTALGQDLSLLRHLGFSKAEIEAANVHVCGAMTLEGAPHLQAEHLAVFDCASPCGRTGTRFLSPESHIRMMAAAQPFLSGAISKTVNMPNSATVEDCKSAYMLSWKLGLKANAVYRDGSKLSQPLSAHRLANDEEEDVEELLAETPTATVTEQIRLIAHSAADHAAEILMPHDQRLPVRPGLRHTAVIDGQRVTLQTRLSNGGQPTEVSIDAVDASGRRNQIANDIAVAISVGLQHGVPLDQYVDVFTGGINLANLSGARLRGASGLVEHVVQTLGMAYLGRHEASAEHREVRA